MFVTKTKRNKKRKLESEKAANRAKLMWSSIWQNSKQCEQ